MKSKKAPAGKRPREAPAVMVGRSTADSVGLPAVDGPTCGLCGAGATTLCPAAGAVCALLARGAPPRCVAGGPGVCDVFGVPLHLYDAADLDATHGTALIAPLLQGTSPPPPEVVARTSSGQAALSPQQRMAALLSPVRMMEAARAVPAPLTTVHPLAHAALAPDGPPAAVAVTTALSAEDVMQAMRVANACHKRLLLAAAHPSPPAADGGEQAQTQTPATPAWSFITLSYAKNL